MWIRFVEFLRCPLCGASVDLSPFKQVAVAISEQHLAIARTRGLLSDTFDQYVEEGVLICGGCAVTYPVVAGLPVMLPYATRLHREFNDRYRDRIEGSFPNHRSPEGEPPEGERSVMNSFSEEWRDYEYDGVIWEMSYEDHTERFRQEMGPALRKADVRAFLEIGCGLGITTELAQKDSGADAVGLDLSLAAMKAARHFRANPFLHFVQGSVFSAPLKKGGFDLVYSRGVLHHTRSTQEAFAAVVPLCRSGGTFYLWVYGVGSVRESAFRRLAYSTEKVVRPVLSQNPSSIPARLFLHLMGFGYMGFNASRRLLNREIQPLTLSRAVHAARDRFTPKYAHRHATSEVVGWFETAGFERIEVLDWRVMPRADHDDYRRNVGTRGVRK